MKALDYHNQAADLSGTETGHIDVSGHGRVVVFFVIRMFEASAIHFS
jgi:hypothetical protein